MKSKRRVKTLLNYNRTSPLIKSMTMKLTKQRMTRRYYAGGTPEATDALTDWLEEQLDSRGIDAVVYTRYILSLLQDDITDDEDDSNGSVATTGISLSDSRCSCKLDGLKPVTTNKWKHRRYIKQLKANNNNNNSIINNNNYGDNDEGNCWTHSEYCNAMNGDEERKMAVVQCLKSASEQEFGIESFVDELCAKLKKLKSLSDNTNEIKTDLQSADATNNSNNNNNCIKVSPKEMAKKYYAAFPSLDTNSTVNGKNSAIKVDTIANEGSKEKIKQMIRSRDRNKWNGQKIIEFMTSSTANGLSTISAPQLTTSVAAVNSKSHLSLVSCPLLDTAADKLSNDNQSIMSVVDGSDIIKDPIKVDKVLYCEEIESTVLGKCDNKSDNTSLVNSTEKTIGNTKANQLVSGMGGEEIEIFQRLVDKFNSNIASIWPKTSDNTAVNCLPTKAENIWSFDSSFSSNQSSATPSPKSCTAPDIWSSMSIGINEKPVSKNDLYTFHGMNWEEKILKSFEVFPDDDGFIDGTHDLIDEESNWMSCNTENKSYLETATSCAVISLQNHQKNSPFRQFSSLSSTSTPKSNEKDNQSSQLSKLLSMVSLLNNKPYNLSPPPDENLLTSPRTHFQPIKQDSFDRDESDDGSIIDGTDHEIKNLVICSDKCPNNVNNNNSIYDDNNVVVSLKLRPLSTSLDELASYIGPFDYDYGPNEIVSALSISDEFSPVLKENKMSDKSTNTEREVQLEEELKLEPIVEANTQIETEPEYQDLYNMINEVLRNGISDSELLADCTNSLSTLDDWYDSDYDNNGNIGGDVVLNCKSGEKRQSWNYYWDTYDMDSGDTPLSTKNGNKPNTVFTGPQYSAFAVQDVVNEANDDVFDNNDYYDDLPFQVAKHPEDKCNTKSIRNYVDMIFNKLDTDSELHRYNGYDPRDSSSPLGSTFQLKPRLADFAKHRQKPCSFFIDGNCMRSDCKYSHDIGSITCKYWEEGFCFKAELCPFLHGYAGDDDNSDRQLFPLSTSKEMYTIESESDFPSLAINVNNNDDYGDNNSSVVSSSDSESTLAATNATSTALLEQHFFNFRTKSVSDSTATNSLSKAKLPITVVMKKKVKKRKDRNLQ